MATRKPVVLVDGSLQELSAGDTLEGGGGASLTSATLPANLAPSAGIGISSEAARADHAHRDRITISTTPPAAPMSGDIWLVI